MAQRYPDFAVKLADPLVVNGDDSATIVATTLVREVRATIENASVNDPKIIVIDHGSPRVKVTGVRNRIASAVQAILGEDASKPVMAASMERRKGDVYAFNEPLLETALDQLAVNGAKEVVIALQFLQGGRHAGPGGDIAQICTEAEKRHPGLRTFVTRPLVGAPEIVELLSRRYGEAVR
ncbi:MAG: CbiX/SirB N-terminal domain-containing protein [Candidatus Synoicihabitans palmerolidicus]|nr:CbiX/SirB N-terminal domain-containing protein [Candidatus Synoicihabitans palmerolidicus]